MATTLAPHTWENGYRKPLDASETPWIWNSEDDENDPEAFVTEPSKELVTSSVHNDLGINVIRTWPTLFDGTNNPHGVPSWWKPADEVDVLIVGGT